MSSSTTGDPDGQALPNSLTQAPMSISAIPVTAPSYGGRTYGPVYPSAPVFSEPRDNRIVLTQAEWMGLQDLHLENQRLKKTLRNYGFGKAAMVTGLIMSGLMMCITIIVIFGAIIQAAGLVQPSQIKENPSPAVTAPSQGASSASPLPSSNVGNRQVQPSSKATHASVVSGQTCVIITSGRKYCAQPAPSESGKACVVYPSGYHHCGTLVQGG